ncbi:hypothetical protein [Nocardia sp. NPDC005366]|uniref:hypothetical protein n=1 Tax=Nocardia sp. NPDC005366 TaxID=3156878 RepID=UPI0033AFC3D7
MTHTEPLALTPRDMRALAAIVQQRAIQADLLTALLGTTRTHASATLTRLRRADLVLPAKTVSSGLKWTVPTPKGVAEIYGRRLPDWTPSRAWCAYGRIATQIRIALGATDFDDWNSERDLRVLYRRGDDDGPLRRYPYDGRLVRTGGHGRWAVKIDTLDANASPTDVVTSLTRAAQRAELDGCTRLLYVCTGLHTPVAIRTAARAVPSDLMLDAVQLEDLTDPTTGKAGAA